MGKLRVYELAKKLNVSSKDIIEELAKLGIEVKSHSSSIEDKDAEKITGIFTKKTKSEQHSTAKALKEAPKPQFPKKGRQESQNRRRKAAKTSQRSKN